jgi:hypothetical protein
MDPEAEVKQFPKPRASYVQDRTPLRSVSPGGPATISPPNVASWILFNAKSSVRTFPFLLHAVSTGFKPFLSCFHISRRAPRMAGSADFLEITATHCVVRAFTFYLQNFD